MVSMFEVKHRGGQVLIEIGFEHLDVNVVHAGSSTILLDRFESAVHACHINSFRKGMDFRAYSVARVPTVGQTVDASTEVGAWQTLAPPQRGSPVTL